MKVRRRFKVQCLLTALEGLVPVGVAMRLQQ